MKGQKKPKLTKIMRKGKQDGREEFRRSDGRGMDGQMKKEKDKPKIKPGTRRQMNKKEARHQSSLEKMHRDLYAGGERILLVGEGNFSFAHALCKHLGSGAGVYATCLDSEAELKEKYADAPRCKKEIEEELGGTVLTGVDATRLHKVKEFKGAFRKIVFNFPHLGTGEKDVEKSVSSHRQLLAAFFKSAVQCLDPSKESSIHISLKVGEPYKSWKLVQTQKAAVPELDLRTVVQFVASAWPGYNHRRTKGFSEAVSKKESEELANGCKVYVFRQNRQKAESEES